MAPRPEYSNSGSVDENDHVVYEGEDSDVVGGADAAESSDKRARVRSENKLTSGYVYHEQKKRDEDEETSATFCQPSSEASHDGRPENHLAVDRCPADSEADVMLNHQQNRSAEVTTESMESEGCRVVTDGREQSVSEPHSQHDEGEHDGVAGKGISDDDGKSREKSGHLSESADNDKEHAAGCTLYVRNLPPHVRTEHVREHFSQYGDIVDCRIIMNPVTKDSRGFGFVSFATPEIAEAAMEKCVDAKIDGKTLRVERARRNRPHDPTPGEYKGPTGASIKYDNCGRLKPGYVPYWHLPFSKGDENESGSHRRYRRSGSRDVHRGVYERRISSSSGSRQRFRGGYHDYSPVRGYDHQRYAPIREHRGGSPVPPARHNYQGTAAVMGPPYAASRDASCRNYYGRSSRPRGGSSSVYHPSSGSAGGVASRGGYERYDEGRQRSASRSRTTVPYKDQYRHNPPPSNARYSSSDRHHHWDRPRAAPYPSQRSMHEENAYGLASRDQASSYYAGHVEPTGSSARGSHQFSSSYDSRRGTSSRAAGYNENQTTSHYWNTSVSASPLGGRTAKYAGGHGHHDCHARPSSHHHPGATASPRSREPEVLNTADQYLPHHHPPSSSYNAGGSLTRRRGLSPSPCATSNAVSERRYEHRRHPQPLLHTKADEPGLLYSAPPPAAQSGRPSTRSRSPAAVRGGSSFACHH